VAKGARWIRSKDVVERARGATLLFAGGTALWVGIVSNLVETGENNRFRVMIDPLVVVLVAFAVSDLARRYRSGRPRPDAITRTARSRPADAEHAIGRKRRRVAPAGDPGAERIR
jgi:hypothetical protein